ncbi:MAG: ATP-dependent DNA helicase RecG [Phenylobacterium sp.]|jgi:ATP-dependent DNA helicase RecG
MTYKVDYTQSLLNELIKLPHETEWVEFKVDNAEPAMIGQYLSALANSAALFGKQTAYVVWGVDDTTHDLIGTRFLPTKTRHKQQELESWLLQKITPKIEFNFSEFTHQQLHFVILEIQAASHTPVQFDGTEFIRVGSYKKKLKDFPEKERALWRTFDKQPFEHQSAAQNQSIENVLKLLDYPAYFDTVNIPLPENREDILKALEADRFIEKTDAGLWNINYFGAILFAKNLQNFRILSRKGIRLILYNGNSRIETIREIEILKGYAVDFNGLIENIKTLLPANEVIGQALRKEITMYPELAIRELVANALIHQDFTLTGTGPMVEIFSQRVEMINPGIPLVDTDRFLDSPPRSRNEAIASFLRRVGICEERGSGIDKVVFQTELHQLPPPLFEKLETHTRATLFAHREFKEMNKEERLRASYMHCVLKYLNQEPMNNTSIRERFNISEGNSAMASRLIKLAIDARLIRLYDRKANRKAWRYVPFWS